jgi:transposase
MYIRKTTKKVKDKVYENYLLVESVMTPKGPRQRTICSLGHLKPRPRKEWLLLAQKIETALKGQLTLEKEEPEVEEIVKKAKAFEAQERRPPKEKDDDVVAIHTDKVEMEKAREAGPVHVGCQFWKKLEMDEILKETGFSEKVRLLTLLMVMNRLISPSSEHKMPNWINSTALSDILSVDLASLNDEALYRNLDELHPRRGIIEALLAEKEKNLFSLDDTIYLYDLTSTYFEGMCLLNPQAKRGYSRDKRFDSKQVLVGLVIDRDGFPKAHEIFSGERKDSTTLDEMLDTLEKRVGKKEGATVVVDRGMAFEDNISEIKRKKYHYIVATRGAERNKYLDEFEKGGFHPLLRNTSSTNPSKKKSGVFIKKMEQGDELYVLCLSDKRSEKDRAIRESHEKKLLSDLKKLVKRIVTGRLKKEEKTYEAIGRIKERYPRVARYYRIEYDSLTQELSYQENAERKSIAESLDGSYMLRTDRTDMSDDEIWRTYSLLTRCENAFRNMKSPLCERPIFHQLERRVQTHIFLCILAYHLLVAIEKTLLDEGIHTSWLTVKDTLKTHQVATVILPTTSGEILKIRKGVNAEPPHLEIYKSLKIPSQVMKPVKTWHSSNIVTERTHKPP